MNYVHKASPGFLVAAALTFACSFALHYPRTAYAKTGDELFKLLPTDGNAFDHFGWLGVDLDGSVALIGASGDDNEAGSAYLFDIATGMETHKLLADDRTSGDIFGWEVAIDGGKALIGAPHDESSRGAAYLFDVATGMQLHKLIPNDVAVDDEFGVRLTLDNGVAFVASLGDDDNGMNSGSVYVFDVATGSQVGKLLPSDGVSGGGFGLSIAIDDGVAVISAYQDADNDMNFGSAYLFDVTTGQELRKLLPADGAAGDSFGNGVAIDNGLVLVGSPHDDENGVDSGAAYLFDAATGTQLMKLMPDDSSAGDIFGDTVAMHNGIALIGAYRDQDNGVESGSAYLFDVSTGAQLAKITPSDGAPYDRFSLALAIDDGVALLGSALNDDQGMNSGSVYLFSTVPEPSAFWLGLFSLFCLSILRSA